MLRRMPILVSNDSLSPEQEFEAEVGTPPEGPQKRKAGLKSTDAAKTSSEFNESEWMYPASNTQGQNAPVHFRVPPSVKRLINEIVSKRRFPYGNDSDLFRKALFDHLKYLNSFPGCPGKTVYGQVLVMQRITTEEAYNQEFTKIFVDMEPVVNRHLAEGARKRAIEYISRQREEIAAMPDKYWRDRYLRELDRRFGHLLRGEEE